MQKVFLNKLQAYISENNPDLLLRLEEKNEISLYLTNKVNEISKLLGELQEANTPAYIIEETCMNALTKDLRPSRFNYVKDVLEQEFEYAFSNFQKSGILRYEVINIIVLSEDVFDAFDFNEETENDRQLKYAVIGIINEYLSK